jgi:hypothetical protein
MASGEDVRACLRELHVSPGFVQPEPAAFDRQTEAGFVFGRAAYEVLPGRKLPTQLPAG